MDTIDSLLSEGERCLHSFYPSVDNVPLYIHGTGGLRLLKEKEVTPLFYHIANELSHSLYPFSFSIENFSILSGIRISKSIKQVKKKLAMDGIQ